MGRVRQQRLLALAAGDPRILFTGFVFGQGYREPQTRAACDIQATEVGGTHPALVEAMGAGIAVIANDTPEQREVGGTAVAYYDLNDDAALARQINRVLGGNETQLGEAARQRASELYSWRAVTLAYERVLSRPPPAR